MFKKYISIFFFSKNNNIYVFRNFCFYFILVKVDVCFLYVYCIAFEYKGITTRKKQIRNGQIRF